MKSGWKSVNLYARDIFAASSGRNVPLHHARRKAACFYFVRNPLNVSGISSPGFEVAASHSVLCCLRNFDEPCTQGVQDPGCQI